jgi:hypothetical protein
MSRPTVGTTNAAAKSRFAQQEKVVLQGRSPNNGAEPQLNHGQTD